MKNCWISLDFSFYLLTRQIKVNKLPPFRVCSVNTAYSSVVNYSHLVLDVAWKKKKKKKKAPGLRHAYATSMNTTIRGCYSISEPCLWNEQCEILLEYSSFYPVCIYLLFVSRWKSLFYYTVFFLITPWVFRLDLMFIFCITDIFSSQVKQPTRPEIGLNRYKLNFFIWEILENKSSVRKN